MSDEADKGNEIAELFLKDARNFRKEEGPSTNVNHCYYCGKFTAYGKRWGNANCRNDWGKLKKVEREKRMQERVKQMSTCVNEDLNE